MEGGFKVKEYPEKSWSISKMKVIENCLREYYYTYYGSHNGWIWTATEEQKVAWRLKKLTNIWLMFGDKLHGIIKETIKEGKSHTDNTFMKECMRTKLNEGVKESIIKFRNGSWDEYPKGEMLQEYYYGNKLEDKNITEIKERIDCCSENFFKSKTYLDILKSSAKVLEVDEGNFDYIYVQGVKIFALIDALYIDEEGNYIIVDWKTGKFSEHDRDQLLVYALYVIEKYGAPLEKIRGRVEYLLLGENAEYTFTHEDIDYINNRIHMDLNVIDAFLDDENLNKPRVKEDFLMCDNLNKCKKCKFRKLCLKKMEEVI
ncbi:PD-(D/E)XK nuclease family protein [Clostridium sp. LP20]|uniref:PD-(D/E)XK nuclease family protein n=1 Tax=Clostridium sp. LP20 TaxID=3418665 RepID=UPI003EE7E0B2